MKPFRTACLLSLGALLILSEVPAALAKEKGEGGGMPAVLSAADEVAVEAFIGGKIRFTDIARVIEKTMAAYSVSGGLPGFQEVVEIDAWARRKAEENSR